MEWFDRVVLGSIRDMMRTTRETYGVDPVAFRHLPRDRAVLLLLDLSHVAALARRRQQEIIVWSMVFLGATAAPFVYVLLFGRNLPGGSTW